MFSCSLASGGWATPGARLRRTSERSLDARGREGKKVGRGVKGEDEAGEGWKAASSDAKASKGLS